MKRWRKTVPPLRDGQRTSPPTSAPPGRRAVQACPPSRFPLPQVRQGETKAAIGGPGWCCSSGPARQRGRLALRTREAREQKSPEIGRKLALTEQGIREALDRGTTSRAELPRHLEKAAAAAVVTSPPAGELLIKTAQGDSRRPAH